MTSNQQEKVLEEFRREWREEVKEKHKHDSKSFMTTKDNKEPLHKPREEESMVNLNEKTESLTIQTKEENNKPVTAMDHYIIAIDNERQGKIGKALESYRRAFKLDANIDFVYKNHYQTTILPKIQAEQDRPQKITDEFKHIVPIGKEFTAPSATRRDPLQDLIEQFLNEENGSLDYIPNLDYKPVLIAKLPSEIMLNIVRILVLHSVSTIPYFALVCKKFFLYSRDPSVWQYACIRSFRKPTMTLEQSRQYQMEYVKNYNGHWLRMFIDRPRIRYDGVYISTCHYIRPGISETSWNQPIHFVTYYRYIRFFPNGRVLKHVTTTEPAHVVRLLQSEYNKKQCFHGKFKVDDEGRISIVMKDSTLPRETFYLTLNIKTTHRGRHNKLVWNEYYSTSDSLEGRGDHHYDLKLLKSYFFSPVRSYKVQYPSEFDSSSPFNLEDDHDDLMIF
ncbi:uncharacterized protein BX663DRAFT_508609 [Cokeromyces recurvatus]|uniref:uncharacterized protein n=1 Tax=Cokeromyces recurvatus TaxID=90255 RepID=UPI00221FA1C5|nr:uncharacterized protein BX663DRAFT_508609 [Cokeromyces recurvatus]KAI7902843.1 hypothetical protein BX663DRAFT_508609 [Cokeromyces recurvatus]